VATVVGKTIGIRPIVPMASAELWSVDVDLTALKTLRSIKSVRSTSTDH